MSSSISSGASQILFYNGNGVGPFSSNAFYTQLKDLCDDRIHRIVQVSSLGNCWSEPFSVKALVVPGGNALTMSDNTKGDFQQVQSNFSKYPIAYYGACAGGILASSVLYERGPEKFAPCFLQDKSSFPLLELYPGAVIAPLFPRPVNNLTVNDFNILKVNRIGNSTISSFNSVHILSPGYLNVSKIQNGEELAKYEAMRDFRYFNRQSQGLSDTTHSSKEVSESVYYKQKNGAPLILTGSHPEMDSTIVSSPQFRNVYHADELSQQEKVNTLKVDDAARKIVLKENFERLGIICKK